MANETTKMKLAWLASTAGWAWFVIAGGGGGWLLVTRGPWPPTNGWFALLSGLAACPLVGSSLRKYAHMNVSPWHQFAAALLLFASGHAALAIWPHT